MSRASAVMNTSNMDACANTSSASNHQLKTSSSDHTASIATSLIPVSGMAAEQQTCSIGLQAYPAITVRKANQSDQPVIVTFNKAMAKETEGIDIPEHTAHAGVAAVLEDVASKHGTYYLLEDNGGQVVGQLMITYEWSDWRAAWVWWIQSVYVIPECRGRGYFKKLYEHVRQEAAREGAAGLRLYADTSNATAHATYERLGMVSHYKVYEDMFTSY